MSGTKLEFFEVIKSIAKILYEREHVEKEGPLYMFDEMQELLEKREPALKDFFK